MKNLKFIRLAFFLTIVIHSVEARQLSEQTHNIDIPKVESEPLLADYQLAMGSGEYSGLAGYKIDNFIARSPVNGKNVSQETFAFLSYDESFLYSIFVCFDNNPGLIRSTISSTDEFSQDEDSVALHLIPFTNSQQMYGFQANASGSKIDGMYSDDVGWDLSFNPVWFTESTRTNNGYIVKMKVPLASLRFPPGNMQNWGFFVYRGIPRNNEGAFFPQYSTNISSRISQAGVLQNILVKRKSVKVEMTPFVTTAKTQLMSSSNGLDWQDENQSDLGMDAKLVWDDRVVVDLTLNPDFSQIESDEPQIVTNERFEVFFPEKRPFFIENADYFNTPLNLLFTRKIVNPSAGLRTTAQIGDWSVGGLLVDDEDNPSNNRAKIAVSNVRRTFGEDSYLGLFVSDYSKDNIKASSLAFQARYRFNDSWNIDSQFAHINNDENKISKNAFATFLTLNGKGNFWNYSAKIRSIAEEFNSPIAYIPRKAVSEVEQFYSYRFLASNPLFLSYTTEFKLLNVWDVNGDYLDESQSALINAELPGQTFVSFEANKKIERLGQKDYQTLDRLTKYNQNKYTLGIESLWFPSIGFDFKYKRGDSINYLPAQNVAPDLAKLEQTKLSITFKATPKLKFKMQFLENKLDSIENKRILLSKQFRLKTSYQFNQHWSLRMIIEEQKVNSNGTLTSMDNSHLTIGDVLLKWESTPGNSLFLGYGSFSDVFDTPSKPASAKDKEKSLFFKFTHKFNSI